MCEWGPPFHTHFGEFMKMIRQLPLTINLMRLICKTVVHIRAATRRSCKWFFFLFCKSLADGDWLYWTYQWHQPDTLSNRVMLADCRASSPSTWRWLAFLRMVRGHWQVHTSLSRHYRCPISRCSRPNSVPAPRAPANSNFSYCAVANRTADGFVGRALSALMSHENRTARPSTDWSECDWHVWNGGWNLFDASNLYQAVHRVR